MLLGLSFMSIGTLPALIFEGEGAVVLTSREARGLVGEAWGEGIVAGGVVCLVEDWIGSISNMDDWSISSG